MISAKCPKCGSPKVLILYHRSCKRTVENRKEFSEHSTVVCVDCRYDWRTTADYIAYMSVLPRTLRNAEVRGLQSWYRHIQKSKKRKG